MNSDNQLNKSGKNLAEQWIADIRAGKKMPDQADPFEKDAAEGWQKASGGSELMKNLDKRFNRKPRTPYYIAGLLIAAVSTVAGILLFTAKHVEPPIPVALQVPVEKIDVVLPKEIQVMEDLPADLQIQPKQVQKTFRQKAQQVAMPAPAEPIAEAPIYLSPRKLDINQPKAVLSTTKKKAKEIYLTGMKLIDYRAYRSKPQIASQQIVLGGLPANQEKVELESDDADWKPIDIPYYDYIAKTVEQFAAGNMRQTLNRTQSILTFYPDDANALFYGGLCYYNLNEMDQAIVAFQHVIEQPYDNFDEEAVWYLANAYDLKNERSKARELYRFIAGQKGFYAKQAEKRL